MAGQKGQRHMGRPGRAMVLARKVSIPGEMPPPGQHRSPAWLTAWDRLFNMRLGSGGCPFFTRHKTQKKHHRRGVFDTIDMFRIDRFLEEVLTRNLLDVGLE